MKVTIKAHLANGKCPKGYGEVIRGRRRRHLCKLRASMGRRK